MTGNQSCKELSANENVLHRPQVSELSEGVYWAQVPHCIRYCSQSDIHHSTVHFTLRVNPYRVKPIGGNGLFRLQEMFQPLPTTNKQKAPGLGSIELLQHKKAAKHTNAYQCLPDYGYRSAVFSA